MSQQHDTPPTSPHFDPKAASGQETQPTAWITADDLAHRIGVSRWWVTRACQPDADPRLPHSRFGSRIRFSPDDVAAVETMFVAQRQPHAAPSAPRHPWGLITRGGKR